MIGRSFFQLNSKMRDCLNNFLKIWKTISFRRIRSFIWNHPVAIWTTLATGRWLCSIKLLFGPIIPTFCPVRNELEELIPFTKLFLIRLTEFLSQNRQWDLKVSSPLLASWFQPRRKVNCSFSTWMLRIPIAHKSTSHRLMYVFLQIWLNLSKFKTEIQFWNQLAEGLLVSPGALERYGRRRRRGRRHSSFPQHKPGTKLFVDGKPWRSSRRVGSAHYGRVRPWCSLPQYSNDFGRNSNGLFLCWRTVARKAFCSLHSRRCTWRLDWPQQCKFNFVYKFAPVNLTLLPT